MSTKRDRILKVIEITNISAEDAMLLFNKLDEDFSFESEDIEQLCKLINYAISNELDNYTAFKLAEVKRKLLEFESDGLVFNSEGSTDEDDFDEDENSEEDELNELSEDEDRLRWLSLKAKAKVKATEDYLINRGDDDLLKEVADYIINLYPDLLQRTNRYLIGEGENKFLRQIGTADKFYFNSDANEKWRFINIHIDDEITKRKYLFDKSNINEHLESYLSWALTNEIVRHTKQSIKFYMKRTDKSFDDQLIDELKRLAISR